ncbi:prepilin-type N-terminal cleavage/methylation domain-containing protein [Roseovarius sp.]|uniref:prepilin-type N-terminal cleavage/methylation domain-containing protein n=1 Tax=Roseovarius sp. TaxID=1486281 RepID=UPI003A983EAC
MERIGPASEYGFTLLEMVIVVAVIAVLSITATFSVTQRKGGESDVLRFGAAYDRLRDAAILGHEPRGVALVPEGWQVLLPPRPGAPDEGWQPIGRAQKFRGEVRFQSASGQIIPTELARVAGPDLVFLPDGQVTRFDISFITNGTVMRCYSAGLNGLACEGI